MSNCNLLYGYGYYNIPLVFIIAPYTPPSSNCCSSTCCNKSCENDVKKCCNESCENDIKKCCNESCENDIKKCCDQNVTPYCVNTLGPPPYDPCWPNNNCCVSNNNCCVPNNNCCPSSPIECLNDCDLNSCASPFTSLCPPNTSCVSPCSSPCAIPYTNPCTNACTTPYVSPYANACATPCVSPYVNACATPYVSPYANACVNPCAIYNGYFILTLTITTILNYTFTISCVNSPTTVIASGTASLVGNILNLTFTNDETTTGIGNINFLNYNVNRYGIFQTCGNITTTFPYIYSVYPYLYGSCLPIVC
jgi:hypothetical protein